MSLAVTWISTLSSASFLWFPAAHRTFTPAPPRVNPHQAEPKPPPPPTTPPPGADRGPIGTCLGTHLPSPVVFAAARLLDSSPAADSPSPSASAAAPSLDVQTRRSCGFPEVSRRRRDRRRFTCGLRTCQSVTAPPQRVKMLISTWPETHPLFVSSVREDQPKDIPLQTTINKMADAWLVV